MDFITLISDKKFVIIALIIVIIAILTYFFFLARYLRKKLVKPVFKPGKKDVVNAIESIKIPFK